MTPEEAIQQAAIRYLPESYGVLLRRLGEVPLDAQEIADYLGMTLGSTYKLVMVLKSLRVICVVAFRRDALKGAPIKVWGLGDCDVPAPAKISPAARSKAWRERQGRPKRPRANTLDTFMKWATTQGDTHGSQD